MLRSFLSSLLAISVLPSCADQAPIDELAGEDGDGEAGKGDAVDVFTFFEVSPDLRACSLDTPDCGGFLVSRPNRSTTTCGFALPASSCYVDSLDLAATGMPAGLQQAYVERIRNGENILLRGEITPSANDDGAKLTVTEVWTSGSAKGAEGVMVMVEDLGIRCDELPCESLIERRVNSNRFASISHLDLLPSTTDPAALLGGTNGRLTLDGIEIDLAAYPGDLPRLDMRRSADKSGLDVTIRARAKTVLDLPVTVPGLGVCRAKLDTAGGSTDDVQLDVAITLEQSSVTGTTRYVVGAVELSNLSADDVTLSGSIGCELANLGLGLVETLGSQMTTPIQRAIQRTLDLATASLTNGNGLIVVGERFFGPDEATGRTANAFFVKASI